ncbi:hypothetical protein C1645_833862 [Glomus cerebriforme]|uniref:Uncharacterized protein n=1 Tax=Glomus cerebriforme TaxID=658196 RepID=A0A397SEY3_9GLOM|nr:hypothetical protein C1645_833862 [Glomus cerebriforme]
MNNKEEAVSDDLGQIAQEVANRVTKSEIDISTFSLIFQELIRIQCNKAKEIRYHPMYKDIVEVNIGKNNYEKAKIIATNLDRSKFSVYLLDPFSPNIFQVDQVENAMGMIDKLKEISTGTRGFLEMVKEIFILYPEATIEPRRISQDMLEGLFGTIRQLGGDSSTQTLKGYGNALNKFQITALVTAEIKSVNYGTSNHTGMDFNYLSRYDYRKKSTTNNNVHPTLLGHAERLSNITSFI